MCTIFENTTIIKTYAQIQKNLINLRPRSSEDEINFIINQIPPAFLTNRRELMMICQIFAYYARNLNKTQKGNAFRLFDRIIKYIKAFLPNESTFFWYIFGGLLYYKLWFYEEGLISIEVIIQHTRQPNQSFIAEYFAPEIKEKYPEIYEKEIKPKYNLSYTEKELKEFKEKRKKHIEWLRNSNDFNDPLYKELETDKLRYSIKTDDIDTFQRILSNLNISLNSHIKESTLDNFFYTPHEVSLIEYACCYDAFKIFKFLIMNNADVSRGTIQQSICYSNYDMFHIIERQKTEYFDKDCLLCSISNWNYDVTEYALNNFDFSFLEKSDVDPEYDEVFLEIFETACFSFNFQLFELIIIPFFRKNPLFVKRQLYQLFDKALDDRSSFLPCEFLKYPGINVNYSIENGQSLLIEAIRIDNLEMIDILLRHPDIDVNSDGGNGYHPLMFVCAIQREIKMLDMFCKHPKINVFLRSPRNHVTAFQISVTKGNTFAIDYFYENKLIDANNDSFNILFFHCCMRKELYALQVTLTYYMKMKENKTKDEILQDFKNVATELNGFNDEYIEMFQKVLNGIRIIKIAPPKLPPSESFRARKRCKTVSKSTQTKRVICKPVVQKK